MKVLIVVHGFPPAAHGGAEICAEAHARALVREHGDRVTVLTRECDPQRPEYEVRAEEQDGVRIVRINNTFRSTSRFEETYCNDAIGRIADRLIDETAPDAAHIHHLTCLSTSIVGSLVARRIPTILTLHDYWLLCHRGQLLDVDYQPCDGPEPDGCRSCIGAAGGSTAAGFGGATLVRSLERTLSGMPARAVRRVAETLAPLAANDAARSEQAQRRLDHMRAVCARVTHFIAPSHFIRDRFVAFGVPSDRISVSANGIDHPREAPPRQTLHPPAPLRLALVGSLMVSKAPHLLLEAVDRLAPGAAAVDVYGEIAAYHGDDRYRSQIEPLLRRPGVRFHGAIAHDRIACALATADVLVVPSIWAENSPLTIQEAFLAGVPVVASRIGGMPEVVIDGLNGLLFRPGDVADLARVLARLIDEPGLLARLRTGIPPVRRIEESVGSMRRLYGSDSAARPRPRLAAIVLNFRTPDETFLAVTSLLASDRAVDDVIVVDNGARDEANELLAALQSAGARLSVHHTGANLGFSGGMNAGIREALARGADRILLVNSDASVPPDCIARLEQVLDRLPAAGITGPVILARSDPRCIASLGMSYAATLGRMRHLGFGETAATTDIPEQATVDGLSGCVMLIRREVLDRIGLLDEDYFYSFEDLDFCLRAGRAGFASVLAGDARAYHEGNRSIGVRSTARLYFAARNHLLLARRTGSVTVVPFAVRAAAIAALNVMHAMRSRGGTLPARLGAVLRGIRDYAIGRFGAGSGWRGPVP